MFNKPIFKSLFGITAITLTALTSHIAYAKDAEIRIARQYGLGYLPTMIMENNKYLDQELADRGIEGVKISWPQISNAAAMNDALLSNSLDFASGALTAAIIAWDRTKGTSSEIKGVAGESVIPFSLYTNKEGVETIEDFDKGDQIAMTAVKVTTYAILLQMEAAKRYGVENYDKADPMTVSMPHPAAYQAIVSGQIAGHFTWPPYSYAEEEEDSIHKITDSTEILDGNPMSSTVIWARKAFRDDHPELYEAFLDALDKSIEFINENKEETAEIYVEMTGSKEPVLRMLNDPAINFDATPHGIMKFAEFLHNIGTIKHKPESWKDFYFDNIHDRDGD